MLNIPNIPSYIQAPWEEEEACCPKCYRNFEDVRCDGFKCEEGWCFDCENWAEDCECEGEE